MEEVRDMYVSMDGVNYAMVTVQTIANEHVVIVRVGDASGFTIFGSTPEDWDNARNEEGVPLNGMILSVTETSIRVSIVHLGGICVKIYWKNPAELSPKIKAAIAIHTPL
jgi:hypothetical protein